ncbi:MAG: YicC/YloC family endoribonuclease [Candidatus Cyclobacteriaceae bacterium M3_2C_046]
MLKSMTGFGSAILDNQDFQIFVEIRSLNSKYFDASLKIPKQFSEKEMEVRSLLSEKLERGKINVQIEFVNKAQETPKVNVNKRLFEYFYDQFSQLASDVNAQTSEIFKLALQAPEVLVPEIDSKDIEKEFKVLKGVVIEALEKCNKFRSNEGKLLEEKILNYIKNIEDQLEQIPAFEQERLQNVRERLNQGIKELVNDKDHDKNRFEQELIYYIEKLDINEEKVRLKSHLDYFKKVIYGSSSGKKLNFISQEMGREINTIGSKANNANIQKIVVGMKEELEKIKEQLLNIV